MSTLSVGTIKSLSSAAPAFQNSSGVVQGELIKQWGNYNGYTNTLRDSTGISSVTDEGTGRYRFNFSVAYGSTNYAWTGAISTATSNRTNGRHITQYHSTQSTSNGLLATGSCEIMSTMSGSNERADADFVYFMAIG